MAAKSKRFVAKAQTGRGWRIFDNRLKRFWGPTFPRHPAAVIGELNSVKRGQQLNQLVKQAMRQSD